jgi:hypothetical protein
MKKRIRIFEVTTETTKLGEAAFTYRKAAESAEAAIERVKKEEYTDNLAETILSVRQIAMED